MRIEKNAGSSSSSGWGITDGLACLCLVLCGVKLTWSIESVLDLSLMDESYYLGTGLNLSIKGFPKMDYGPLYCAWYHFLSWFQSDPVALFYLNVRLLTILPALFIYLVLRQLTVRPLMALSSSFGYLISVVNLPNFPKPVHAALVLILMTLFIANHFRKQRDVYFFVSSIGLLTTSYLRPEYFLAFLGLLFCLFMAVILYPERRIPAFIQLGILLLILGFLKVSVDFPMFGRFNRNTDAIIQNYAYRLVEWNHLAVDPWTNAHELVTPRFGKITGLLGAIRADPSFFTRHVYENAWDYIKSVPKVFFLHYPVLLPSNVHFRQMEGVLFAIAFLVVIWRLKGFSRSNIKSSFRPHVLLLIFAVICMLPSMLACIIQLMRYRYLVVQVAFGFIIIAIFLNAQGLFGWVPTSKQMILTGLLFVGITPPIFDFGQPQLQMVQQLRALGISGKVNMLEAEGGYDIYLGSNYKSISPGYDSDGLKQFLESKEIKLIVLSPNLNGDMNFRFKDQWKEFLEHYEDFGFKKVESRFDAEKAFLVRKSSFPVP